VKTQLAIDLGHRHLRAVEASVERGRVAVVRTLDVAIPADVAHDDHAARGAFVASALKAAGMGGGRATWTVFRERAAVKRLALPAADASDLPGMVRLAMQRESAVQPDAVIDFVAAADGGAWAVAVPPADVAAVRAVAESARIGIDRLTLRTFGTVALAGKMAGEGGGAVAALDLSLDGLELVVAGADGLRATRGVAVPDDDTQHAVTEARRSWTAHRLQQPGDAVARAVAIGPADVAAAAAAALAADTGVDAAVLESHPDVQGTAPLGACWPLCGLLLEAARRAPVIDLARPRRTPDMAVRRRMRVYAAVAVVGIAYAVGWTLGKAERGRIEQQRTALRAKVEDATPEWRRFKRDELRARHLDAWAASQPAWLDSLLYLNGFAPDPARVVLAGWNGQAVEDEVAAAKDGSMRMAPGVRIVMDAETADRATADALRESLLANRELVVRSNSSEGKAGRRLPVAVELVIDSPAGAPVERPANGTAVRTLRGPRSGDVR
jgi:hypothetical protein